MSEFWLGDSNGPMGDVGAFMASELRVDRADLPAHIRQLGETGAHGGRVLGGRVLVALAGAQEASLAQLSAELVQALNAKTPGCAAALPQQMFRRVASDHAGNAPEDYDPETLLATVQHLSQTPADQPMPDIPALGRARVVLVTGPHLLLTRPVWRDLFPLFDLSIRLSASAQTGGQPLLRENRAADLVVLG